ncbi:MAG: RES family NAD+ phosphorylase [Anaerolineales bacterium]|nr:RES family NAD+ phosphorylase [Anaerolineales bacterium]
MRYRGKVWRHVPAGAHPLNAGYILRAAGRWNRPGIYGCLYTSLTPDGARAEYHKYLRRAGVVGATNPRELVSIEVDIDAIVDLTDSGSSPVPPTSPFLTGDDPKELERCRSLADSLRARGCAGILAPSSAAPGDKNLAIYIDGIAGNVTLEAGADRLPL